MEKKQDLHLSPPVWTHDEGRSVILDLIHTFVKPYLLSSSSKSVQVAGTVSFLKMSLRTVRGKTRRTIPHDDVSRSP